MGTTWTLLLGQVLVFSLWPFLIVRTSPATRIVLFQVAVSVLLMFAGVLGAVYALALGAVYALALGPVQLSLGNIAYAAVIMTSVAMFAATRDPKVIRDAVRLVVAVNLVTLGVLALTAQALRLPDTLAPAGITAEMFRISIRSTVVGGALHVVQLLLLAAITERARRATSSALHGGPAWAVDTAGDGAHLCVELPLVATCGPSLA